jgi:hypothetical protein
LRLEAVGVEEPAALGLAEEAAAGAAAAAAAEEEQVAVMGWQPAVSGLAEEVVELDWGAVVALLAAVGPVELEEPLAAKQPVVAAAS